MAKLRPARSRMMVCVAFGMVAGALLLAFFLWHILNRAPQEGRDAAADKRALTLPLSAAAPEPPKAGAPGTSNPGAVTLVPPPGEGLKPASETLTEQTPLGPLPKISADGLKPWQYYGRAFKADASKPGITVVVTGLGLAKDPTEQALHLPPEVSLGFSPYAGDVATWAAAARAAGHEVLVDLPLEPANYPAADPGPQSLLTGQIAEVNAQHLRWVLSRFPAYVGVTASTSEHFLQSRDASGPVAQMLAARGLMMLLAATSLPDPVTEGLDHAELPYIHADARLEGGMTHEEMITRLLEAERIAGARGHAVVVAGPEPMALKVLAEWSEAVGKKGIILIPLSALARLKFS